MNRNFVSKGIFQRVLRGEFFGRTPWGYRRSSGNLVIIPEEAKIVEEIYERYYENGEDYHEIARDLNERGIVRRQGNQFHAVHIKRIVESKVYFGKIVYKGKVYPGKHEPIIKKEYILPGDYAEERMVEKINQ